MKWGVFILLWIWMAVAGRAQTVVPGTVENGDTIAYISLPEAQIEQRRTWKSRRKYNQYIKLQRKVVKVYPFARLAAQKLEEYAQELAAVESEKEKRKFYKQIEREIKLEYEGELRKLTISEGRILIKLLDRETGNTSYALVEELRGKFSAFFWQSAARIFGHNLKSQYDPNGADKEIEFIVRRIERGEIPV